MPWRLTTSQLATQQYVISRLPLKWAAFQKSVAVSSWHKNGREAPIWHRGRLENRNDRNDPAAQGAETMVAVRARSVCRPWPKESR